MIEAQEQARKAGTPVPEATPAQAATQEATGNEEERKEEEENKGAIPNANNGG